MKKTGYLYDNRFLLHDTGIHHPETPSRLTAIHAGIKKSGLIKNLIPIKINNKKNNWIEKVHDIQYINSFKKACLSGKKIFTYSDNKMSTDSYKTATIAVNGILKTTKMVIKGEIDNAFCAIRPPGHHAESNQALGFCYFNNIAIATRYLQIKWKIKKICIIDFDAHHGNGTQHIFEKDPNVFYYSIHQHPSFAFPGTGRDFEKGLLNGIGYTKNSTILPGQGDNTYKKKINKDLLPIFKNFKPEIILTSTGFDAHKDDYMSDISLSTNGYSWIAKTIFKLAEKHTNGKIISILEGGYNLDRLPELAINHVKILLDI